MDNFNILFSWQLLAASVAIYAIITAIKKIGKLYILTTNKLYQLILTLSNIILGFIVAIPPGFLPGDNYFERLVLGIVAGFLSNYTYQFVKRFLKEKGN
jgi:hypothetical protein